jgi:hypothetical protein
VLVILMSASCAAISGLSVYSIGDSSEAGPKSVPINMDDSSMPESLDDATTAPVEPVEPVSDAPVSPPVEGMNPADTGADSWTAPPDANDDVSSPPPVVDAGPDVAPPVIDAGPGPTCGPLSSRITCPSTQVCCANLSNYMNACSSASSCSGNTTLSCSTAADCPASAPICCGKLSTVTDAANDLPPKCTATGLSASCAASCADSPPADPTTCKYPPAGGSGLVRLCSHDKDCMSDTANSGCYNFNSAPVSWCSAALAGLEGVHQP